MIIRSHWEEGKEDGYQCSTCGKIFGCNHRLAYKRHLATHDEDTRYVGGGLDSF